MSNTEKQADDLLRKDLNGLINLIEDKDIKKCWLAKQLNISRQTLNDYLNGTHDMPHKVYLQINCIASEKVPQ